MSLFHEQLKDLGFTDKQIDVYLYLLREVRASAKQIYESLHLNKVTAYKVLNELVNMEVVSVIYGEDAKLYICKPPDHLWNIINRKLEKLKEQRKLLKNAIPELVGEYNKHASAKPQIRFYEGKKGLSAIRKNFLEAEQKEICGVFSGDDVERVFSEAERVAFSAQRKSLGILSQSIYTRSAGPYAAVDDKAIFARTYYIRGEHFPILSDISIYDNKVAIASLREHLWGVVIENHDIAETLRTVFALAVEGVRHLRVCKHETAFGSVTQQRITKISSQHVSRIVPHSFIKR